MQLPNIIKHKILKEGPLSFCEFMQMALYYPGQGYYVNGRKKIGKDGDFYTSPLVSPLFGDLIARQICEMKQFMQTDEFTILEYGAGTGALCLSILNALEKHNFKKLNYCLIEKNPAIHEIAIRDFAGRVRCCESIHELQNFEGCILSNELLDNFSVHRVVMETELMEVFVDYHEGFVETLKPAPDAIKDYFAELKVELPVGQRAEVNLQAISWLKEISSVLKKGYVITIDYGYPSHELYDPCRKNGTLTCYQNHQVNDKPLEHIGQQDITAHVNFSALCHWGFKYGLEFCGYRNQGDFLMALGFKELLYQQRQISKDPYRYEKGEMISNLLIEDMGKKFKVLIQQKQLEKKELLGLKPMA